MKILIVLLLVHGFYDRQCCGGQDCHPVACEEIRAARDGWLWHFAGDDVSFSRNMLRISQDGGCHVCVHSTSLNGADNTLVGQCIYLPPQT
jgi:hypothetical protein